MTHALFVVGGYRETHCKALISAVAKRYASIPTQHALSDKTFPVDLTEPLTRQSLIVTVDLSKYAIGPRGISPKPGTAPLHPLVHTLLRFRTQAALSADPFCSDPVRYNVIRAKGMNVRETVSEYELGHWLQ